MSVETGDTRRWYVVHTHPKQEERADRNLQAWGLETLTPKLKECKYNQFNGKPVYTTKPLFPGYIFTRFKLGELYQKVRFTRGVQSLVCFNNRPTPVDEEIVSLIRSRIGLDGFVRRFDDLKPGDRVVVNDGRFQNFCGVFERSMKDADRVRIMLSAVSYQVHVVVDRASVRKLDIEGNPLAS